MIDHLPVLREGRKVSLRLTTAEKRKRGQSDWLLCNRMLLVWVTNGVSDWRKLIREKARSGKGRFASGLSKQREAFDLGTTLQRSNGRYLEAEA